MSQKVIASLKQDQDFVNLLNQLENCEDCSNLEVRTIVHILRDLEFIYGSDPQVENNNTLVLNYKKSLSCFKSEKLYNCPKDVKQFIHYNEYNLLAELIKSSDTYNTTNAIKISITIEKIQDNKIYFKFSQQL